jgi:RHS repeat-associated protein
VLYSYDAYGNPGQVRTAATARISAPLAAAVARANALRYAGYAFDAHSGLYYLSKRHYDPATAQFLTKDPAKADGGESPYQYCGGDPAGKVDPSGEAARRIRHARTSLRITAHNLALQIIFPVSAGMVASAEVDWSLYSNGLLVVFMAVTYNVSDYIPKGAEIDCDLRAGLAIRGEAERSNGSLRRRRTFDRWAFNSAAKGRFTYALAARAHGWISAVGLEAEATGRWVGDCVTNLRTHAKRTKWSGNPFGRHRPGWRPPDCRRCHSVVPYSQSPVTTCSPRRQVLQ